MSALEDLGRENSSPEMRRAALRCLMRRHELSQREALAQVV